jgi:DNA-binding LacI/PurR family transcriptional regulator
MGRKPKPISITKIANESGLSVSTVSRALNHRSNVSEEARQKIHALMQKYQFKVASAVEREKKIALLASHNQFGDYVSQVLAGIYEYVQDHNMQVTLICPGRQSNQSLLQQVRDQQCSGIIVIIPAHFLDSLDELAKCELPVILIDEAIHRDGLGFIDHDSYSGSRVATEYLLELGHRKIGYLHSSSDTLNHIQRYKAYENTLQQASIRIRPTWFIRIEEHTNIYQASCSAMQSLLQRAPEVTAVMTSNDSIAIGAMHAAVKMGRRIPEDLSLIGFDNYQQTAFLNPPLTTVDHPIHQAGFMAAQQIDQYLQNASDNSLPHEILPTRLIKRGSTATCTPK